MTLSVQDVLHVPLMPKCTDQSGNNSQLKVNNINYLVYGCVAICLDSARMGWVCIMGTHRSSRRSQDQNHTVQ